MIISYKGKTPKISKSALIAPNATVIGDVTVGENSSVWFNAVLRGDTAKIVVGDNTNIQDNATVHVDEGYPVVLGDYVTVGHNAVVHGATVGNNVLIGMNAVLLNGASVGDNSIIGASSVLTEGKSVPENSLAFGIIKEFKPISDAQIQSVVENAKNYVEKSNEYAKLLK